MSGTIWEFLAIHKKEAQRCNKIAEKYLGKFLIPADKSSIFRWLKLPQEFASGITFEQLALKHGVQVYAAERFALGNSTPEKTIRLPITAAITPAILEKGLLILHKFLLSSPSKQE